MIRQTLRPLVLSDGGSHGDRPRLQRGRIFRRWHWRRDGFGRSLRHRRRSSGAGAAPADRRVPPARAARRPPAREARRPRVAARAAPVALAVRTPAERPAAARVASPEWAGRPARDGGTGGSGDRERHGRTGGTGSGGSTPTSAGLVNTYDGSRSTTVSFDSDLEVPSRRRDRRAGDHVRRFVLDRPRRSA